MQTQPFDLKGARQSKTGAFIGSQEINVVYNL